MDASAALARAFARLDHFRRKPLSHVRYGLKVLVKFKLLELQTWPLIALYAWAEQTRYIGELQRRHFPDTPLSVLLDGVVKDLEAAAALRCESGVLLDAG